MKARAQTSIPQAGDTESEPDRAPSSGEATAQKLRALEERLGQLGSLMAAYSGGGKQEP